MEKNEHLNTKVLPEFNCSNCEHFIYKNKEIFNSDVVGAYAVECINIVHPLMDCVLRGFEAHSSQPGFSQTINNVDEDK